jgi:hypothetical protein
MQLDAFGLAIGARNGGAGRSGNKCNQAGEGFHERGILKRAAAKASKLF